MVSYQNDATVFLTRPVSAVILGVSALMVVWPLAKTVRARRRAAAAAR